MAGEFVACLTGGDFQRETQLGYEEGMFLKYAPGGQMRGLIFPKLTAGPSAGLLGYITSVKIPSTITMTNGLTFKLQITDDGTFTSDPGKACMFGITCKLLTPGTSNTDMGTGGATEVIQTTATTLNAVSGVIVLNSIAVANASLNGAAVGAIIQVRIRRVGTNAGDTALGPILVIPPVDVFNT